ncbi:MAG: DUF4116 domain-containing protein [Chlamydiae bacterium]|nr:DUF4116 domain-containing protein [Chlamydiota bacterium]
MPRLFTHRPRRDADIPSPSPSPLIALRQAHQERITAEALSHLYDRHGIRELEKKTTLTVIKEGSLSLKDVCTSLQADKEVALAAVSHYGPDLRYCSETLRADKQVVLAAVEQYPDALKYASEVLQKKLELPNDRISAKLTSQRAIEVLAWKTLLGTSHR